MEGPLEHLEEWSQALALAHKRVWTPRYFRLNPAWGVLEWFVDASSNERRGKIDLRNAEISTADELGELILATSSADSSSKSCCGFSPRPRSDSRIALENARRFVFRITEHSGANVRHHHLCAECLDPTQPQVVDPARSRESLDRWVAALRSVSSKLATPNPVQQSDSRALNTQVAAFQTAVHVSAHIVSCRDDANGKRAYDVSIRAWVLQFERDELLEYACDWILPKSSANIRELDTALQQWHREALQGLELPSYSGAHRLVTSRANEDQRRVEGFDAYFQRVLALPTLAASGASGSDILDQWLAIPGHVAQLQRVQRQHASEAVPTQRRRLVPWGERERFEKLYSLYLEEQQEKQAREVIREAERRERRRTRSRSQSQQSRSSRSSRHGSNTRTRVASHGDIIPTETVNTTDTETTKARIARIGRKLLVEAFQATTLDEETSDLRRPSAAES